MVNDEILKLKSTASLVAKELSSRGVEVRIISSAHSLMQYRHNGVWHYLRSVQGDKEPAVTANLTRDKSLTAIVCATVGVPHPILWDKEETLADFIRRMGQVVVKPISGAHGDGITVGVDTVESANIAIGRALATGAADYLVQQQVTGYDYRVVCIAGKFAAALKRTPASVIGDGSATIQELIDEENKNPERGEPRLSDFIKINTEAARAYLGDRYFQEVPSIGKEVQVIGVSNIGLGGKGEDVTDDIPDMIVQSSEALASELNMGIVGFDFMWDEVSDQAYLIEVNAVPGIDIHESPRYGTPRGTVKKLVDYLLT